MNKEEIKKKDNKSKEVDKIKEVKFNSTLALAVFRDEGALTEAEAGTLEYEMSLAENPDEEVVRGFQESLYGGGRTGFLSPYSFDKENCQRL